MKKRASQKSAEYSISRAEWYRQQCDEILYQKGIDLQMDEQRVYIKINEQKTLLLNITNPKTMWFEIWLKLTDR
jgi:uncharacterized protein YueI